MRISGFLTPSFKQIKMDKDSYRELKTRSDESEINAVKDMSLKGFHHGYLGYDTEYNTYILKGINPQIGKKCIIVLGEQPTAQKVKDSINNWNLNA